VCIIGKVFKEKGTIYAKPQGGKELGWPQELKDIRFKQRGQRKE
jgi:hypothetical protein